MSKSKGSTQINEKNRQEQIALIITRFHSSGKAVTVYTIQKELKESARKIIVDIRTIYRDLIEINKENSFVKDLAQYHYSKMVEDLYTNYSWIYNEARKNYLKKWTLSKTITRISKEEEIIEEVTTEEIAQPKIAFLNIMINSQKAMEDIIDGRSQKISVALLSRRFVEIERELDEANQYKSKYEKLRSSKHIQD